MDRLHYPTTSDIFTNNAYQELFDCTCGGLPIERRMQNAGNKLQDPAFNCLRFVKH
jgi:hypothetical protein